MADEELKKKLDQLLHSYMVSKKMMTAEIFKREANLPDDYEVSKTPRGLLSEWYTATAPNNRQVIVEDQQQRANEHQQSITNADDDKKDVDGDNDTTIEQDNPEAFHEMKPEQRPNEDEQQTATAAAETVKAEAASTSTVTVASASTATTTAMYSESITEDIPSK